GAGEPSFSFSPNGKFVGFTDMGPGPGGDAPQAFVLNVESGLRTQVTHLPPSSFTGLDATAFGSFVDNQSILFGTFSNLDGLNPNAQLLLLIANIDDGHLTTLPVVAVSGGGLIPLPSITGAQRTASIGLLYDVRPVNPMPGFDLVREVFL